MEVNHIKTEIPDEVTGQGGMIGNSGLHSVTHRSYGETMSYMQTSLNVGNNQPIMSSAIGQSSANSSYDANSDQCLSPPITPDDGEY